MSSAQPSTFRLNTIFKRFRGVRLRSGGKWVCEIRLPKTRSRIWLGSHATPEAAARAYDFALVCLRGPDVQLNFPDSPPQVPANCSLSPKEIQKLARRAAGSPLKEESVSPLSFCRMSDAPLDEFSNQSNRDRQQGQLSHMDLQPVIPIVLKSTSKTENFEFSNQPYRDRQHGQLFQIDLQPLKSISKTGNFVSLLPEHNAKTDVTDLDSVLEPLRYSTTDVRSSTSTSSASLLQYSTSLKHDDRFRCLCASWCGFNSVSSSGKICWPN